MRLRAFWLLAMVCLTVLLSGGLLSAAEPKVIRVPGDYTQIQEAIDAALPGDIIQVGAGVYHERVKITKPLILVGQGPGVTTLQQTGTVVSVDRTRDVEIRGFSVHGGTYGLFLWYSHAVVLRDNDLSGNKWNFGVWGESLMQFVHDIDASNTVDGQPIYFWVNQQGGHVPADAGYVALVNSTEIQVKDATLTPNEQGILLVATTHSIIENVTAVGHDEGFDLRWASHNTIRQNRLLQINWRAMYLEESHNNTVSENTVFNSTRGLSLSASNDNLFYHNNFVDNFQQVEAVRSQASWHTELQEGNYWSDYQGVDADQDGIGDTPHVIYPGHVDPYPLMGPYDRGPPIAHAGADRTVEKDVVVTFDAGGSFDDAVIAEYVWDFGDGSSGTGRTSNHTYTQTGTFMVTLTVRDWVGQSATDVLVITVAESSAGLPSWWLPAVGVGAVATVMIVTGLWWYMIARKRRMSNRRRREVD